MAQRVTQAEFARIRGVSRKTVTLWKQKGRIAVGKDGLIDVAKAEAALASSEQVAQVVDEALGLDEPDEVKVPSLTGYKTQSERLKAELLERKLAETDGRLVDRERVAAENETAARLVRKALDAVPSRAEDIYGAGKAGGVLAVRKALKEMMREIEAGLAGALADAADALEAERAAAEDDAAA